MAIILAMVLGLSAILVSQISMVRDMGQSVIAFHGANSGIERTLYEVRKEERGAGSFSGELDSNISYEVDVEVENYEPNPDFNLYKVISKGAVSYSAFEGGSDIARRAIRVQFVGR